VHLDTGEELIQAALGPDSPLTQAAHAIEPFVVPYDQLARIDGWVVWLGHPPVPDGLSLLPVPDHLLWDDPATTVATVVALAADYAARRGARDPADLRETLTRESPLVVVIPGDVAPGLHALLEDAARLGLPLMERPGELEPALNSLPAFGMRRRAHAEPVGRLHDPALSFQHFVPAGRAGGDALSIFVVHNEGERDGVDVLGETGEHLGIEIGIRGDGITIQATEEIERRAAKLPSFLNGVTSAASGDSLEIGWRLDARPTARELGEVFRVWLKELEGVELVDVRVAYAPARERSAALAEMHARAETFRQARAAAFS
jgi:hypothetical protein